MGENNPTRVAGTDGVDIRTLRTLSDGTVVTQLESGFNEVGSVAQGGAGVEPWLTKIYGSDGENAANVDAWGNLQVKIDGAAATDAFGNLRVVEPLTLFDSKQIADKQPLIWDDQLVSGSGGATTYNANQASTTLSVAANTAAQRVRQTFRRFSYQPGKSQRWMATGILGAPATGITRRIGYFDANNGLFFESGPSNVAVVMRTYIGGSPNDDMRIAQSDWNIDKLNGSGASGITAVWSKAQIFGCFFEWLGVGSAWFFVVVNGQIIPVHRMDHANDWTTVYMSTPNLPMRYEINNSGTGDAASLTHICSTVISEGGMSDTGFLRSCSRGTAPLVTLNDADLYPLHAFRLNSSYLHAHIDFLNATIVCGSTAVFEWQLLVNPTVTGVALSYTQTGSVDVASGALNTTKVSGGTLVASGCAMQQNESVSIDIPASDFRLGSNIAGTADVLVLAVRRLTGNTETFYANVNWRDTQ